MVGAAGASAAGASAVGAASFTVVVVFLSAIKKAKAALSAMFATAKEDGVTRSNPVIGTRYVPAANVSLPRKRRPLTLAELDRFLRALPREWRLLFLLLAHTGVRIGELLGLTWSKVHLGDDPHLVVDGQMYRSGKRQGLKSRHSCRTIPLSPGMAQALQGWRERSAFPGVRVAGVRVKRRHAD